MNKDMEKLLLVTGGVALLGHVLYLNIKVRVLDKYIDRSIASIADDISVEVPNEILNAAIDKAVTEEVHREVKYATQRIISDTRDDIRRMVRQEIDHQSKIIKQTTADEIRRQVKNIDVDDLKKEIKDEAKEKIISKFENDLDGLLEEFNNNLANVSKIYESIADTMRKK